jgi:hypothetical protein
MSLDPEDLARVDDYLSGAMAEDEASDFEAQLFEAAAAGGAPGLRFVDDFFGLATWFASRGGFSGGATRAQVDELLKLPNVHYLELESGVPVAAWPSDTKFVAYRVPVDVRGFEHVDVTLFKADGSHVKDFRDVQCDPHDGALYGVCDAPLATWTFRKYPVIARVQGSRDGERKLIATLRIEPAG